jgi:hypothetical protein
VCVLLCCDSSAHEMPYRIEDASSAIEMLRMVSVVLLPAGSNTAQSGGVPAVHSPFVRSVSEYINAVCSIIHCID